MKTWRTILIGHSILIAALFAGGTATAAKAAETPQVVNAKIETRAVNGSLAETLRGIEAQADKPEWVGYSVAEVAGDRTVCCGNFNDSYGGCGTCRLEKENGIDDHEFAKRLAEWNRPTGRLASARRALPSRRQTSDAHSRSLGKLHARCRRPAVYLADRRETHRKRRSALRISSTKQRSKATASTKSVRARCQRLRCMTTHPRTAPSNRS